MSRTDTRAWGGRPATAAILVAMAGVAAVASWQVRRVELPSALRLGSGAFFHVAFGVLVFFIVYALAALVTITMRAGGPPTKFTGLGFSFEAATEALSENVSTLEGINDQLRALDRRVSGLIDVTRDTQQALGRLADGLPTRDPSLKREAERRVRDLDRLAAADATAGADTTAAINRFRGKLADLRELNQEMRRA